MQGGISGNKNEYVFKEMPVAKALLSFAFPAIVSQIVLLAYNLADTYFLGRTANPFMIAAVSLVLPLYNVCVSISNLFGTGGGTLIARLLGAQNHAEARRVSAFSVVASVVASGAFSLVVWAFNDPLLRLLGASDETLGFATEYVFWILILGGIPAVLSMTMVNLARNAGLAKEAGIGAAGSGILNILLDPLFMFVLLPPGREVAGAAIATFVTNLCTVVYFAILFRMNREQSVLRALSRSLPSRSSVASIISVGIPAALTYFLYDLTTIVIDKLTALHGDIPLAAIGIVMKAERLPLNICIGICLGMCPLVGYNFAAKNFARMKKIYGTAQLSGLAIAACCIVGYLVFAGQIMAAFIAEPETVSLGTTFLRVRCFAPLMMFACFNFVMFFQAVGMGRHALVFAIIRQVVFNIPLLFLLDGLFGLMGIVWTQFLADGITALISYAVFRQVARRTWDSDLSRAGSA